MQSLGLNSRVSKSETLRTVWNVLITSVYNTVPNTELETYPITRRQGIGWSHQLFWVRVQDMLCDIQAPRKLVPDSHSVCEILEYQLCAAPPFKTHVYTWIIQLFE